MSISLSALHRLRISRLIALLIMISWIGATSRNLTAQPPVVQRSDSKLPVANDVPSSRSTPPRTHKPIDLSLFSDSIHHWQMNDGRERNDQRYQTDQIIQIAENLLRFQNDDGGWPTNLDWLAEIDVQEIKQIRKGSIGRSSFDNRNTYPQIEYLFQVSHQSKLPKYQAAAIRGLHYILQQQRDSGGWRGNDVDAITFNDDVMVGIMRLLLKIRQGEPHFDSLDPELKVRLSDSLDRAIKVTLDCQITVDGNKTAWCQQHDHLTLKPIKARTYELPSITAQESVGIVRFLMELPDPAPEVVAAVKSAVSWFESAKIEGLRVETFPITPVRFKNHTASFDRREVSDQQAPPIWARFYELDTNRPFFCNRDGKKVYRLSEVQLERRSGYGWYGYWPANLLSKSYPAWKAKIEADSKR